MTIRSAWHRNAPQNNAIEHVQKYLLANHWKHEVGHGGDYIHMQFETPAGAIDLFADLIEDAPSRWLVVRGFLPMRINAENPSQISKAIELLSPIISPSKLILVDGVAEITVNTTLAFYDELTDATISRAIYSTLHLAELLTPPLYRVAHHGAAANIVVDALRSASPGLPPPARTS